MLNSADVVYEISFGVAERDEFEEWFPDAAVEWGTMPGVEMFRVYRGVDGERERLRLVFGFPDYERWHSFVRTASHRESMATLESISHDVRTSLWSPSAVTLVGDQPAVVDADAVAEEPGPSFDGTAADGDAVQEL